MNQLFYTAVLFILIASRLFSQDQLKYLTDDAVEGFTLPMVNSIGSNLNSGWVQRLPSSKIAGIDIEAGVIGMSTVFHNVDNSFTIDGRLKLSESSIDQLVSGLDPGLREATKNTLRNKELKVTISGPTIIGSKNETVKILYKGGTVEVDYNNSTHQVQLGSITEDTQAKGFNLSMMPNAAIQFSIGTIAGTKLTARYLPPVTLSKEFGKMQSYGLGMQHNPMVWFKNPPKFDLSIGCFYQGSKVGDIYKSKSFQVGLFGSKTFGNKWIDVTPYVGLSVETSSTEINYLYEYNDGNGNLHNKSVSLYSKAENDLRFRAGVSFKLGVVLLNADYNFALTPVLSTGFSIIY